MREKLALPLKILCDDHHTSRARRGTFTLREDANNHSTRTFAYVVDDDRLWTAEGTRLKEPQRMGIVQVMKYCPGN
jgi:hypothetical protein